MRKKSWILVEDKVRPTPEEKAAIIEACDRFAAKVLKPRFLPQIRPSQFNYPVDIYGRWHGGRYRFIQRYRSSDPTESEFESAFTRLDYRSLDRFDIYWHRHTGAWFRLYQSVSLLQALRHIEEDGHLHPP